MKTRSCNVTRPKNGYRINISTDKFGRFGLDLLGVVRALVFKNKGKYCNRKRLVQLGGSFFFIVTGNNSGTYKQHF